MKRKVDIFHKDRRDRVLWTYIVELGGDGFHPSLSDFKEEALILADIDDHGPIEELEVLVHLEILK